MVAAGGAQTLINLFLICGIAVAVVQIAGDMLAAAFYPGYSYVNQTVSELSAIGAPTRSFLGVVGLLYHALVVAFAIGVWKAKGRTRAMRITAVLLAVFVLNGLVWSFFPMQQRGSGIVATDIGHIVMAALQVLTMLLYIAFGSGADGRGFRVFSILMIAAILIGGGVTATQTARIAEGLPTPWIGLIERVSFYGPSLWMLALAVVLLRRRGDRFTGE
jgi:tryptophan-rich sensory protein